MQVTKQIHAIKIPFQIPVAPGKTLDRFVYSYLIYDTEICLIDSGIKSSERAIFDSLKKLKSIEGIKYLLASWSDPKEGEEAYKMMDDGLDYLQSIHDAFLKITDEAILRDPMRLCKQMVDDLGLPETAVNPLIARSFASHLKIRDQQNP